MAMPEITPVQADQRDVEAKTVTKSGDISGTRNVLGFSRSVQLFHPTLPQDAISAGLDRAPDVGWNVGAPRRTPAGEPLEGEYPNTYWAKSDRIVGKRFFFETLDECVDLLERRRSFLRQFVDTGGTIRINFGLSGKQNIGDELSPRVMRVLSELDVTLGIEVFPQG
jgi:hypothetical protein